MRAVAVILIIALSLGLAVGIDLFLTKAEEGVYPLEYTELVAEYASKYNIPEYVILAIIKTESDFDPNAVSAVGAIGLMQMMPETFLWLTGSAHLGEYLPVDALYVPEVSIRYGTYYLLYLYRKFDHNLDTALAAYNGGEGNVSKWLEDSRYSDDGLKLNTDKIPDNFRETRNYVKKVNKEIKYYKNTYYQNEVSVK